MKLKASLATDSYKLYHKFAYPDGITACYSNLTPRSFKYYNYSKYTDDKLVWFGVQGFLNELVESWNETFFNQPKEQVIQDHLEFIAPFCGGMKPDASHFEQLHDLGYLPLLIKALPEASLVPIGIPCLTVVNTLPEFYWLPNYLETWISAEMWKTSTAATTSYAFRRIANKWFDETGACKALAPWVCHDFSARGMSGMHDSARCGSGHLLSSMGTDNLVAVQYVNEYYRGKETFVGGSVPATEHACVCSQVLTIANGDNSSQAMLDAERQAVERFITQITPTGIVSLVSDGFDYWGVLTDVIPSLKDKILARQPDALGFAKVVIRPDSGDPVRIVTGYDQYDSIEVAEDDVISNDTPVQDEIAVKENGKWFKAVPNYYEDGDFAFYGLTDEELTYQEVIGSIAWLWEVFGGTVNEKGFKTLDSHIGLIYGDSITPVRAETIYSRLAKQGFAADNVVFGVGSYALGYSSRDSQSWAIKATAVRIGDKWVDVFKAPKTDDGTKKSACGLMRVEKENGTYVLYQQQTPNEEAQGELKPVFLNGVVLVNESFETLRNRLGVING